MNEYESIFIYYSFEMQADILRVLKVFDEPLGDSNTEELKFQENAPNETFIVKFNRFHP